MLVEEHSISTCDFEAFCTNFRSRISSVYGHQNFKRLTSFMHKGLGFKLDVDGEVMNESDNEHHFRNVESNALIAMTTDSIVDQYW